METAGRKRGIAAARLSPEALQDNFADLHPPLDRHEALVEAGRCYFCHDAPCQTACPTGIDIPMFIRQILTDNPSGAAKTIFDENIMGGMCARVCPTETLCEEVCVRNTAEEKPVHIGQLQRYATDHAMQADSHPYQRAASTGKRVAIVGAGPAGMACAHRLALHGHDCVVFEAREKSGGLNEYGIAAYKTVDNFAQAEVDFITGIGGIEIRHGQKLGGNVSLAGLREDFDAVFLGMGMGSANSLGCDGEDLDGCENAIDYIADLRQADQLGDVSVGRDVVVIGGGMTAVDVAVQAKRLGAENVTMAYRRGADNLNASLFEQELAQTSGVSIKTWAQPVRVEGSDGKASAVVFEYTETGADGRLAGTGETFSLPADQVFKAIGQVFVSDDIADAGIDLNKGRIRVDDERRTSVAGIWAGGDCVDGGEDLTVASVEDGKQAAESIHRALS